MDRAVIWRDNRKWIIGRSPYSALKVFKVPRQKFEFEKMREDVEAGNNRFETWVEIDGTELPS